MNTLLTLISIFSGVTAGEILYKNFHGDELRSTVFISSIIVLAGAVASKVMDLSHSEQIIMVSFITVMSMLTYITVRIAWHLTHNSEDDGNN